MVEKFLQNVSDLIEKEIDTSLAYLLKLPEPDDSPVLLSQLIQYFNNLKAVGCIKIKTTVEDDERQTSQLYKLNERVQELTKDIVKLHNDVVDREEELMNELEKVKKSHEKTISKLQEINEKERIKQKELDDQVCASLEEKHQDHRRHIDSMKQEISSITKHVIEKRDDNKKVRHILMKSRGNIEERKKRLVLDKERQQKAIVSQHSSLSDLMQNEIKEKGDLELRINLIDVNESIKECEYKILQEAKLMEDKADKILSIAAENLQRIFRGSACRATVAKMRAKRGKRSKGNKKK